MRWQERTISQVMATRRRERGRVVAQERPGRSRMEEDAGGILRRSDHGEDVGDAVRYLERKCRISFSEAFGIEHFQWQVAPPGQSLLLEQHYDPAQRSYYLFSGQITVHPSPSASLHTTQPLPSPREATVQAECGLGWLFSQQPLRASQLTLLSGSVLQITHPPQSHKWIQRSCLMTLREKQQAVARMPLFAPIQNLSRAHLPHFFARKYVKGEKVYLMGEPAQELYLVIEGEIAFQSSLPPSEQESALRRALLRRTGTVVTETIGKGNYFGQQQILAETPRLQNAKCLSIQALILIIPRLRLQKLLTCSQFKRTLQLSAGLKKETRKHQMATLLSFIKKKQQPLTLSPEEVQKFSQIKTAIYTHLITGKASPPSKGRLNRGKKKVVHNHSLTATQIISTPVKTSPFSMLNVNKAMYDKTLMRFRYHLKEIQKSAQGTPPPEVPRGRSLQDIWRTLKLQKSFNPEEQRMRIDDQDGMASYLSHLRMSRHLKETRCFRPKSLHCGNKLKSEYIEYLQMAL